MDAKESDRSATVPEGVYLWLLLWKGTRSVERTAKASIRATGLGITDFAILEALLHKGPLSVNAFRDKVLLTSGSLTAAVDRLEREGWVKRKLTEGDRRMRLVHLTAEGRKRIGHIFQQHRLDMEKTFSCLNKSERKTLAALLRKLGHSVANLREEGASKAGAERR